MRRLRLPPSDEYIRLQIEEERENRVKSMARELLLHVAVSKKPTEEDVKDCYRIAMYFENYNGEERS